jgi:hypothetical protein
LANWVKTEITQDEEARTGHALNAGFAGSWLVLWKESMNMPGNKHLKGVSAKEQRQYEHIKESAQKSGKYKGRAKEVAARTVMKQHREEGHKKGE